MKKHSCPRAWQLAPVFFILSLLLLAGCSTYRGNSGRSGQSTVITSSNQGQVQWRSYASPNSASAGPYLGVTSTASGLNDLIVMADSYGNVYASNTDGSPAWSQSTGYRGGELVGVADDSSALLLVGAGELVDVNASGVAWTFNPNPEYGLFTNAAFAGDGTIYIGDGCGVLYAVNPNNGKQAWQSNSCIPGYPAPIISDPVVGSDGTIYFLGYVLVDGTTNYYLQAMNPDGSGKWSKGIDIGGAASLGGPNGKTMVIRSRDRTSLEEIFLNDNGQGYVSVWKATAPVVSGQQLHFTLPAIATDGSVYVGTDGAGLRKISWTNGQVIWTQTPAGVANFTAPPTIGGDGTVYVAGILPSIRINRLSTNNSRLIAVNPATGAANWSTTLCDSVLTNSGKGVVDNVNAPMIGSDGTIYMIADGMPTGSTYACPLEAFR